MLQLARISKENTMLVKNEIPKQKFQVLSDFMSKISKRVTFLMNIFTTRQILKENFL